MVMVEDEVVRLAGKQGVMADMPSLLAMHQPFKYDRIEYTPVGHVRFAYANGFWDEWWTFSSKGESWISVDEGDIAIELPIDLDEKINVAGLETGNSVAIGATRYLVTETGHATCEAVRGEIPEAISPGDQFDYWHLSGPNGALITLEAEGDVVTATRGAWIDPYRIDVKRAQSK